MGFREGVAPSQARRRSDKGGEPNSPQGANGGSMAATTTSDVWALTIGRPKVHNA